MKLRDPQSTLDYRLNLWSASLPESVQNAAAITIFVIIGLVLILFSPFIGIIAAIMFSVWLTVEVWEIIRARGKA